MNPAEARPYLLWGALGCTLVGTAHAEYTLATATGVHWFVAGAVPGALDLYVIQALRVHRDVLSAVLVMVAANVASHLVTAGVLGVHWWLISAVGALAPLLLWRIHFLWASGAGTQVREGVRAPEVRVQPEMQVQVRAPEDDTLWIPSWMQDEVHVGAGAPAGAGHVPADPVDESPAGAPAPVTVPEGYTSLRVEPPAAPVTPQVHPYLSAVPALPKGFEYTDTVPTTEQFAAGRELYRETVALTGKAPSQRAVKASCRCNQDTARKILDGLRAEFEGVRT